MNMGYTEKEVIERVQDALRSVNMEGSAKKSINHLSFGERKRVCIAGLLSMGHEILLLDEPTAGLDPLGEYQMMNLLTKINEDQGVTIAMATHSVDLILFFSTALYPEPGEDRPGGTPEAVFTAPEEMAQLKLRMPQIAELIYRLKHEDHLPFERIPLTIGEARRELIEIVPRKEK